MLTIIVGLYPPTPQFYEYLYAYVSSDSPDDLFGECIARLTRAYEKDSRSNTITSLEYNAIEVL